VLGLVGLSSRFSLRSFLEEMRLRHHINPAQAQLSARYADTSSIPLQLPVPLASRRNQRQTPRNA
jgi:hypothetical protein